RRPVQVGIAECAFGYIVPLTSSPEDVAAARRAFRDYNTEAFTLLFEGAYPEEFVQKIGAANMPDYTEEEMKIITGKMDFLGLNIYTAQYVMADPSCENGYRLLEWPDSFAVLDMPGNYIVPEAVYYAPRFCQELWDVPPMYISENGFTCIDNRSLDNPRIDDVGRISALRQYLMQVQRAVADGIPLKGFFYWSLLDNFEWRFATSKRLGLIHVDYNTMARTPKLSAAYYRDVIRSHAVL
ncbi:MAG: family 1 glycosylhydrolase, partial [Victivallales bacterium]|nr:family 1 glycosylhydrolase [Victivallales bacterium]